MAFNVTMLRSVYLSVCLTVYLSVCLYVFASVSMSPYVYVCLSMDFYIVFLGLSVRLYVYLSSHVLL